ncbi:MAG TPA: 30S ribosomal protein S8 [Candidatus Kaiserbacteria bacterium]|nr:30S ribosomal protein S8 [Candidatus Kaiserbacteria bacterium]
MVSDRVGDFIIRLKNASAIHREEVVAPYSKHIHAIAQKLRELGFLTEVEQTSNKRELHVVIAYADDGSARLRDVRRISKPGRRVYISHRDAHVVAGGTGVRIISTPSGIVSDAQARRNRLGGEALFEIW